MLRLLVLFLAVWLTPVQAGTMLLLGAGNGSPAATASYTGPGDIVSGALWWFGLRAYNAAYATGSNPAADVCDVATGATCSTVNILANGAFDSATAAALPQCATACNISKWYDQTGNGKHVIQATNSKRPALTFNCSGSLPCLTWSGGQNLANATAGSCTTTAQPYTNSVVAKRTSTITENDLFVCHPATAVASFFNASANTLGMFAGTLLTKASQTDNNWYAIQFVFNGASSGISSNGSTTTGSAGSGPLGQNAAGLSIGSADGAASSFLTGTMTENGVWPSGFSAGNITSINANQRAYWGF